MKHTNDSLLWALSLITQAKDTIDDVLDAASFVGLSNEDIDRVGITTAMVPMGMGK